MYKKTELYRALVHDPKNANWAGALKQISPNPVDRSTVQPSSDHNADLGQFS
jgi:hypothetical protein